MNLQTFKFRLRQVEASHLPDDLAEELRSEAAPLYGLDLSDVHRLKVLAEFLLVHPDLLTSPLGGLLDDYVVAAADPEDGEPNPSIKETVRQVIASQADLWRIRALDSQARLEARVSAVNVLSLWAPSYPPLPSLVKDLLRASEASLRKDLWYVSFRSAERVLQLALHDENEWRGLLETLYDEVQVDWGDSEVSWLPHPRVAVLTAFSPYLQDFAGCRLELDSFSPGEILEEATRIPTLHLGRKVDLLAYIVKRFNDEGGRDTLAGFQDIYHLLRAVTGWGTAQPEYLATTERVTYMPLDKSALSSASLNHKKKLAVLLDCDFLFSGGTNLLEVFGLPTDKKLFKEWVASE